MQNLEELCRKQACLSMLDFFSSLEKSEETELDFMTTADDCSRTLQSKSHLTSTQEKEYLH